jgi:hypothetical protein
MSQAAADKFFADTAPFAAKRDPTIFPGARLNTQEQGDKLRALRALAGQKVAAALYSAGSARTLHFSVDMLIAHGRIDKTVIETASDPAQLVAAMVREMASKLVDSLLSDPNNYVVTFNKQKPGGSLDISLAVGYLQAKV